MSSRNPRSFAAYRASKFPRATRAAIVAQRRQMSTRTKLVVPGVTRVGGAYRRSIPRKSEETHYNDQTFQFVPAVQGVVTANDSIPTLVCVSPSSGAPVNPTTTPSLFAISQGTTKNQRIGNKIHAYQIRITGVALVQSANNAGEVCRLMLVWDKQANGATASPADVLEQGTGATVAAGTGLTSFVNMDNVERFVILKDKKYSFNPTSAGGGASASFPYYVNFKMNKKINMKVDYSSTTGAVTEIRSNNLFILAYSAVNGVQLQGTVRTYWKE